MFEKFRGENKWRYIIATTFLGLALVFVLANFLSDRGIFTTGPCNGFNELCGKRLNEVAFPMTHNAMSISEYEWFAPSHEDSVTNQLNAGIRGLMLDVHYFEAVASAASYFPEATPLELIAIQAVLDKAEVETREGTFLCHIICQLGSTPVNNTLTEIKDFLDQNKREVIGIIFEDRVNASDVVRAFDEVNLTDYTYAHPKSQKWPTLVELINDNKRLVVMAEFEGAPPDWYHHAWDSVEETPYSFADSSEMNCNPNRGDTDKDFFLLNHWIERVVPRRVDAEEVNEYGFLLDRSRKCAEERGHDIPNFIAVNFYDKGDLIKVVNELNRVTLEE